MASQPKKARTENDVPEDGPAVDHAFLEKVDAVQEAIDSLNKKASVEILKVEQKYNKLRKPHYEERAKLLADMQGFWATVFNNHRQMRKLLTDDDQKVLSYLRQVEVQEFEDITSGYKINFFFDENEWFTNDCLTREYHVGDKGEPVVSSTKINWKPGMCLLEDPDNGKNQDDEEYASRSGFFSWFAYERNAVGDVIGDFIKDELWPNPLQYYITPEPDSDEEEEDGEDDLLDEEEEEEDEEVDDDGEGFEEGDGEDGEDKQ